MAVKTAEAVAAPEAPQEQDAPVLDLTDQAVKRMIRNAKKRG